MFSVLCWGVGGVFDACALTDVCRGARSVGDRCVVCELPLAAAGSTFGSSVTAAELYSRLLYTATHAVLEKGKTKRFSMNESDIESGECTRQMKAAEDMASLVLTQHSALHAPQPRPTFSFGENNSFQDGSKDVKLGGVLFQAKGQERHKRHDLGKVQKQTMKLLSSGQVSTSFHDVPVEPQ